MKIKNIKLRNFRQFFVNQKLTFSTDQHENISVIHGENGSGKTSLLNAFKWCFYGFTDFDTRQDNILNEHAISSAAGNTSVPIEVIVEFEHDGKNYTANRTQEYKKISGMDIEPIGGNVFDLSWTSSSGEYEKSNNPQNQFNQILPEGIHSYFLFNGERIEKLAEAKASNEIRDAIRNLMGLEIMERGRAHLSGRVRGHFNKQMKDGASGMLKKLIEQEGQLEARIEEMKGEISQENRNISGFDDTIEGVEKRLLLIKDVSKLQKRRDELKLELAENKIESNVNSNKIKSVVGTRGFLAFLSTSASHVAGILEEKRQKGELPYAIKRQFIEDLLQDGNCICGTAFLSGSAEYQSVAAYRDKASPEGIEEAFTRTSGALGQFEWAKSEMYNNLRNSLEERKKIEEERKALEGELDEISGKVTDSEIEDAAQLEERRKEAETNRDISVGNRGLLCGKMQEMVLELEGCQKQRKEQEKKSGQVALASKRHTVVEEAARVLEELHDALAEQTKSKLSKRVNETFQKILKKNYTAEIDSDYCLRVLKEIPGGGSQVVHEKSTGESQVTSLSFIASIVSLAHEQSKKGSSFFRGGIFPIIMDSPFGALDPDYRTLVARYIPELAQQVILMVSKSQWDGEVQKECEKRVGQHSSLVYHAPKVREGIVSPYVRSEAEFERTEVEEGYHG